MKRIYIAIAFLLTAFIITAVEIGFISAKADNYISRIEQIDKMILKNDFEDAIVCCEEIDNQWSNSAKRIDLFLIHDYVDDIGSSIAKMRAYVENGSIDMYFAESYYTKKQLASIKESEYPMIENIL
jgi:hypothetical protein